MRILGEDTEFDEQVVGKPKRTDSLAQVDIPPNIEAVHIFSEVGSLAETSRRTKISIYELTRMSREPWWQRELSGIQREQTAVENVRLTSMWGKTLEQIDGMLDKGVQVHYRGKPVLDDEGEPCYAPLNPGELCKLIDVLFTQRQLVRDLPTAIVGSNSKLEELADKLSALGSVRASKVIEADVTDVNVNGEEDSDGDGLE